MHTTLTVRHIIPLLALVFVLSTNHAPEITFSSFLIVPVMNRYNISSCIKLVELSLTIVVDTNYLKNPQNSTWDRTISLLSAIPSPLNLRRLTFTLSFIGPIEFEPTSLQPYDWGLLDQTIARFRNLERVTFLGAEDGFESSLVNLGDLGDLIIKRLPILSAGGRLMVL